MAIHFFRTIRNANFIVARVKNLVFDVGVSALKESSLMLKTEVGIYIREHSDNYENRDRTSFQGCHRVFVPVLQLGRTWNQYAKV